MGREGGFSADEERKEIGQKELEKVSVIETEIGITIKSEKAIGGMDTVINEIKIQEPIKIEKILDLTIPDPRLLAPKPLPGPQDATMRRAEAKKRAMGMIVEAHHRYRRQRSCLMRGLGPDGREMDISSLSRVASMAAVYLHLTGECESSYIYRYLIASSHLISSHSVSYHLYHVPLHLTSFNLIFHRIAFLL